MSGVLAVEFFHLADHQEYSQYLHFSPTCSKRRKYLFQTLNLTKPMDSRQLRRLALKSGLSAVRERKGIKYLHTNNL